MFYAGINTSTVKIKLSGWEAPRCSIIPTGHAVAEPGGWSCTERNSGGVQQLPKDLQNSRFSKTGQLDPRQHLLVAEASLKNSLMHLSFLKHSSKDEKSVAVAFRSYFLEFLSAIPIQQKILVQKHRIKKRAAGSDQTCKPTFFSFCFKILSTADKQNCELHGGSSCSCLTFSHQRIQTAPEWKL